MPTPPQIHTKILQRADTTEAYAPYRALFEWGLEDPIVIEGRDELKSEYRCNGLAEPYHHQVSYLITFCRRLPVTLLADDVGLGNRATVTLNNKRVRIEAAEVSPDARQLAVVAEMRTLMGFRAHHVGFLYSLGENAIVGRIAQSRRHADSWIEHASA